MVVASRVLEVFVRYILPALGILLGTGFGAYALGLLGADHLTAATSTSFLVASALCLAAAILLAVLANQRSQLEQWHADRAGNEIHHPSGEGKS